MEPVAWPTFQRQWLRLFKQGQHVTIIGPTGCGKTRLATELIAPRSHVVTFGVKHVDESMTRLLKNKTGEQWVRMQEWKPGSAKRVVLWPSVSDISKVEETHKRVFNKAIGDIYKAGGWCLWLDETRYMADHLGMRKPLTLLYVAGRSNNISIVANTQRPSWIPLEAYSQAGHLFLFKTGDERDLARLGSLNGANAREVAALVSHLPRHHFLHVDLNTGKMLTSKLEL